ncbi:MAG: hypothetical protein P9M15_05700, partial [Candidatus Electryoneaceae bacterium]|nr:hypothetical protein [Candidatus Electryoneaceae bacterium]
SGIDIPNVNTLIINRADRFGLAQLYQIRGRIGRSNRQAYAYLLAPPKLVMSSTARQRLSTLTELTDLGSGLKIAMRDLEIRGAGNLLGSQQSGYINSVGFELYTQMLEEAIRKIKNEQEDSPSSSEVGASSDDDEIKIDFDGPALLPDDYINDGDLRYNFYRKISLAKSVDEIDGLDVEMEDRFGPLPQSSKNLLGVMSLKLLGRLVGCERMFVEKKSLIVMFRLPSDADESHNLIRRLVLQADPEPIEFRTERKLELIYRLPAKNRLLRARRFLHHLTRNTGNEAALDDLG